MENLFWSRLDELIESSEIILDRPKGSRHPRYPDLIFPLDYGYLEGTTAVASKVDMEKRDSEIKLIIGCTDEEITIIEDCHNSRYQSAIIIKRDID